MGDSAVRVAVLGAGAIAQVAHLPILSRMRGVEVVAVVDADQAKARVLANRFSIPNVHRSEDALWRDGEVDAVIVCTPSHLHADHVTGALSAGKYVLCEKPLALSAADARRVLDTPGAEHRLVVGMNQRYRPDTAALKSFLVGGELGELFYLRAGWLNRRISEGNRSWREQRERAGGGVLMDLGVQMLDLSLWLLDYPRPERVAAYLHRARGREVEDAAVLLLGLRGGGVINLEVTWSLLAERERQYVHLLGTEGSASVSPLSVFKQMESGLVDVTPTVAPGRENVYTASYRQELQHFIDVVRGEKAAAPPHEHVILAEVVEAAYRSASERTEVRL